MQNKNYKLPSVAKENGIDNDMAYRFNKQWKANGETIFPGYNFTSEIKVKETK